MTENTQVNDSCNLIIMKKNGRIIVKRTKKDNPIARDKEERKNEN